MPWMGWRWRKNKDRLRPERYQPKTTPVKQFTACTFCAHDRFYEGPSGGVSQNITCSNCGARFNIGLIPGGPILLDTLSGPTKVKETG